MPLICWLTCSLQWHRTLENSRSLSESDLWIVSFCWSSFAGGSKLLLSLSKQLLMLFHGDMHEICMKQQQQISHIFFISASEQCCHHGGGSLSMTRPAASPCKSHLICMLCFFLSKGNHFNSLCALNPPLLKFWRTYSAYYTRRMYTTDLETSILHRDSNTQSAYYKVITFL